MSPSSTPERAGARPVFRGVEGQVLPDSRFRVRVTLMGPGEEVHQGEAVGTNLAEGRMRAGAEAALQALARFPGHLPDFTYRGARTVRAFDTYVVIVALRVGGVGSPHPRGGKERRRAGGRPPEHLDLVGCVAIPDRDLARGAVLAVLNASNRLLERGGTEDPPPPSQPPPLALEP